MKSSKNWFKHIIDFTELSKITSRIYSNCSNYSLFFKFFKFRCCSFCLLKEKITVNYASVLLILLFTSRYIFQRKSKEWVFGGCYSFLYEFFKKNGLGPITSTLVGLGLFGQGPQWQKENILFKLLVATRLKS